MKKLLLIAYHFPPDAAVGSLRLSKFVKYLPESGFNPYVITVREKYYKRVNSAGRNGYNKENSKACTKVFRTCMFPVFSNIYRLTKEKYYSVRKKQDILEYKKAIYNVQKKRQMKEGERVGAKIRRIFNSLCCLPDDKVGWLPFAFLRAFWLIKKEKIQYVLTTSPPHSTHLTGFLLKKCLNIRWFADFRDPWWIDYNGRPSWARSQMSDYCENKMEEKILKRADKIIFVTERMREGYQRFYPQIDKKRFVVITNGYDPNDFSDLLHLSKFDKFTLTYTGTLYHGRTPFQFFMAIRELIEESKISKNEIDIRFIGHAKYAEGTSVIEMARGQGIESLVTVSDSIPHKEALELMVRSHVLLLFAPDQYYQIPAKAYEYMASGSYIIAFAGEGATKDLMDNYEMGITVNPDNVEAIKEAVLTCYEKYMESYTEKMNEAVYPESCSEKGINGYDFKKLARQLTSLIHSI